MAGNTKHVINMANSIVGVSILSMPFCFREAGLLLGVVLVLLSAVITKKTCMFLIRSAIMARRRSYEFLAFHVFGVSGKLFVELCMILFLIGISISFHVVMGDLAPAIVARAMNLNNSPSLRCTLLIGIGLLVVLPLCLLRKLDSLASMSACSILFYFFLVTVIIWHAFPKLMDGSWYSLAELWRPAGALQVLPICMLGLSCQSNVFEIYDSVPDPDVPKMRSVVNQAINLCSALYISVGFFGYIAFVDQDMSGNLILNFPASQLTEGIKMFFTVSLAISFPLMIFPCRTSINSLLYRRSNPSSYDLVGNYMPESRFKGITIAILSVSLVIGILIPNIEFVLGLLGSTMGVLIALILPSILFIKVNTKTSAERFLAQFIMLMGLLLLVLGTYLNLAHIHQVQVEQIREAPDLTHNLQKNNIHPPNLPKIEEKVAEVIKQPVQGDSATRREPVAPEPPPDDVKELPAHVKGVEDTKAAVAGAVKEDNKGDAKAEVKAGKEKEETLHPDAIKKEEKEGREESEGVEQKQAELLEKMEVQHKEQQQILAEQKQILQELKDQKAKQEQEQKRQEEENKLVGVGVHPGGGAEAGGGLTGVGRDDAVGNVALGNLAPGGNVKMLNNGDLPGLSFQQSAAIIQQPQRVSGTPVQPAAPPQQYQAAPVQSVPAPGQPVAGQSLPIQPNQAPPGQAGQGDQAQPPQAVQGQAGQVVPAQPAQASQVPAQPPQDPALAPQDPALAPQVHAQPPHIPAQAPHVQAQPPQVPAQSLPVAAQAPQDSALAPQVQAQPPHMLAQTPAQAQAVPGQSAQAVPNQPIQAIPAAPGQLHAGPVQGLSGQGNVVPLQAAAGAIQQQPPLNNLPNYPSAGGQAEQGHKALPPDISHQQRDTLKKDQQQQPLKKASQLERSAPQGQVAVRDTPQQAKDPKAAPAVEDKQRDKKQPKTSISEKKKTRHDEERRKRDVGDEIIPPEDTDLKNNPQNKDSIEVEFADIEVPRLESPKLDLQRVELPVMDAPNNILLNKDIPKAEGKDVVYDTRHLLWNGRSRRKKRRNDRGRDDYYWDET